jgi:hypothetical protein
MPTFILRVFIADAVILWQENSPCHEIPRKFSFHFACELPRFQPPGDIPRERASIGNSEAMPASQYGLLIAFRSAAILDILPTSYNIQTQGEL